MVSMGGKGPSRRRFGQGLECAFLPRGPAATQAAPPGPADEAGQSPPGGPVQPVLTGGMEIRTRQTPLIQVRNLCKSLDGVPVLENVSLEIDPGEELSIIGSTGCGKTVLTKHFNGLLLPDSGTVKVCGVNVADAGEAELYEVRRKIGYVFQGNALFASLDVYENVSLPLRDEPYDLPAKNERMIAQKVERALTDVGVGKELFRRLPSELSGGQRKRVAVARAIVGQPPIVVYDEPTTGLDPEYTEILIELIERLHRQTGNTTVAITHEKKLMKRLRRVIFLRDRQVYFDGSYSAFVGSDDPVIHRFLAEGGGGLHTRPGPLTRSA
jgi:phospholipid/cholesterol/gamma-HCH transport system ATP-binding protein